MSPPTPVSIPSPAALAEQLTEWLDAHRAELAPLRAHPQDFDARVEILRELQGRLFEAGWVRYGWPEEVGGLGGNELHRAAVYEALARAGFPPRIVYEHVDILIPTLARFGQPELARQLLPRMLSGQELWCQGFSEPTAGSDLAALRTRAEPTPAGFRIHGHKIWTSWATHAQRCMLLARTGDPEARHRTLTMFVVDVDAPGVTVNMIRQANGTPELAEVFLDGVTVDSSRVVGEVDGGWAVAMYLLSCERGSFPWQRHAFLAPRLEALAPAAQGESDWEALGEVEASLFAVRTRAWSGLRDLAAGRVPGPEAAVNKVLASDAEQHLYRAAARILSPLLEIGAVADAERWQEELVYANATSIYGGARQIQLNIISRHLLGGDDAGVANEEYAAYLEAVTQAVGSETDGRAVLEGLGWWDAASPFEAGDGRLAFASLFEAQGRELAHSPALGAVRAGPLLEAAGLAAGLDETAALDVLPAGDGSLLVVFPACAREARHALFERPGSGWERHPVEALAWQPATALDEACVGYAPLPDARGEPLALGSATAAAAERSLALARTGACFEILGACESLLAMAVEHAEQREQFGKPLAEFQAVQHLLAESHVELTGLREMCHALLAASNRPWPSPPATALTKLWASRCGPSIARRSLQVLGAIGFTDEHPHHRYLRRVQTLGAVLGHRVELARSLGRALAESGSSARGLEIADLPQGADSA